MLMRRERIYGNGSNCIRASEVEDEGINHAWNERREFAIRDVITREDLIRLGEKLERQEAVEVERMERMAMI
jgi:hypothetical protein